MVPKIVVRMESILLGHSCFHKIEVCTSSRSNAAAPPGEYIPVVPEAPDATEYHPAAADTRIHVFG
jgi:hypothetical protein